VSTPPPRETSEDLSRFLRQAGGHAGSCAGGTSRKIAPNSCSRVCQLMSHGARTIGDTIGAFLPARARAEAEPALAM